jgi:hypothetical protein
VLRMILAGRENVMRIAVSRDPGLTFRRHKTGLAT